MDYFFFFCTHVSNHVCGRSISAAPRVPLFIPSARRLGMLLKNPGIADDPLFPRGKLKEKRRARRRAAGRWTLARRANLGGSYIRVRWRASFECAKFTASRGRGARERPEKFFGARPCPAPFVLRCARESANRRYWWGGRKDRAELAKYCPARLIGCRFLFPGVSSACQLRVRRGIFFFFKRYRCFVILIVENWIWYESWVVIFLVDHGGKVCIESDIGGCIFYVERWNFAAFWFIDLMQ